MGTIFSQYSIKEEEKTIMPRTRKTPSEKTILFVASNPTKVKYNFKDELHRIESAGLWRPGTVRVAARWLVSLDTKDSRKDRVGTR